MAERTPSTTVGEQKAGGDEQKGGTRVHVDPSYTAKSGAQVEKERDARPYRYEVEPK